MKRNNKGILVLFIAIFLLLTLVGCKSKSGDSPIQQLKEAEGQDKIVSVDTNDQEKNLRIAFYSEDQFMREYGNFYKKKFPNTKLHVIPTINFQGNSYTVLETSEVLEQKPDVVFGQYSELAQAGKLLDLEPYLRQHEIGLEQFAKPAIEWLRDLGMGHLVALSPGFQTAGLYYNKTLFDELQIPYPSDHLTWENLLQLAEDISRKDIGRTIYGLDMNEPASRTMANFIFGMGVDNISEDRRTSYYTSDDYRTAASRLVDAFRMDAIHLPSEQQRSQGLSKKEYFMQIKFISGEAAMAIRNPAFINDLVDMVSLGIDSFEWEIAPMPVNPRYPGESTSVYVSDTFAIYSEAENRQTAWEFIQFIIGPEMGAELANTKPSVLSIRMDVNQQRHGREMDAFFAHRPFTSKVIPFPKLAGQQIQPISEEIMMDILYGRTSISNGLETLHNRVQHVLDEAWKE